MYNYNEAVKEDLKDFILEYMDDEGIKAEELDADEISDIVWTADSVTGNGGRGYYPFNTYEAEENLTHNWDILAEALTEYGQDGINAIQKGAEWCDITIRCYLVGQFINEVIEEIQEEQDND